MGPANRGLVGMTWPNKSSSPGPDSDSDGSEPPTCATCPAADTVCMGVTRSASQIAPAVTTRKART